MKEELRKLKGACVWTDLGEITLCDTLRQNDCEFDQLYFSTEHHSVTVKVYDLSRDQSAERFRHEQQMYLRGVYDELASPLCLKDVEIKKHPYGILAIKVCRGLTLKQMGSSFNYNDWLTLTEFKLKNQKQVYLNLNPTNIARNSLGEFKITDPQFISNEGTFSEAEAQQEHYFDMCQKEYRYKAPQLLDQYLKGRIDYRTDLFSFATLLYQLLYHQYPFQSKLAQISCNYKPFPETSFFTILLSKMLKPYHQRAGMEELIAMVENEREKIPKEQASKSMSSGSTNQSKGSNLFSGLTQMFSKLTTETQSWYLNFTQNDSSIPEEKYLNLLIGKLYKKEAKLQKLQSVLTKYLQESTPSNDYYRLIKTGLLMIQLFRRGPNIVSYQWEEILQLLEGKASGNAIVLELSQFFRQKSAFHAKCQTLYRGNFYMDDFSKFKLVTIEVLSALQLYLNITITSIKTKFLFMKKDQNLLEYIKELYCDEIHDSVSTLIFSILSIRKDNELNLRKDPLDKLKTLEKHINGELQKISYLSNHVDGHPIYSMENEYLYYQEQIQLKDTPFQTSLEHFYKYLTEYKGLCVPQNYSLTYSTGDQKEFLSNQNNRAEKPDILKEKQYFVKEDEEESQQASFKVIDTPSPEKQQLKQKFLQLINKQKPKKEQKSVIASSAFFNVKPASKSQKPQQIKKVVDFEQFFKVESKAPAQPIKPQQFSFPDFGKKPQTPQQGEKKVGDFAFFDDFFKIEKEKKKKQSPKRQKKADSNVSSFFQNFGNFKEKGGLVGSSSQKVLQDPSQFRGMNKPVKVPFHFSPQKDKPQIDSELLKSILSGLRLKELKDAIVSNQEVVIHFEKLKLQKVIGSGSAGEVYFGRCSNEPLAIKKVKTKENPNALKEFQRELLTYIKIKRNPYLVSLVGLSKSNEDYYLLTQFCNAGSLFDLLHKRANSVALSWKHKISLAIQVAKGMLALHQMKPPIIHRDLKSLNVFVIQNNGVFTAKVADFGLSRSPESDMMTMYLGTLHWMAPQLLDNKQYSIKVDIYSFAVVLWEICSRKTPYNQLASPMAIIKHVTIQQKRPNLTLIPADCPLELTQIIKSCWCQQPNDRPSFSDIIDSLSKVPVFF